MDNEETLNLSDDDYMSGDENIDQDEEYPVEADSLVSTAENKMRGNNKLKRSKCWRNFQIIGDKLSDGRNAVRCSYCNHNYCIDLRRSGTTTLLRHMKVFSKTHGSTLVCENRKLDMMVFREMIAVACLIHSLLDSQKYSIIEHYLPYSFVEYKKIREAFLYANSSIEELSRYIAAADCLNIFEKEKTKPREILNEVPGRFFFTTDLWRELTIEGYIYLTAHYIDSGWNLKTTILSLCAFPPPHTSVAIAMKVMELLKE